MNRASAVQVSGLSTAVYRQYDERFVYAAPDLKKVTARKGWARASAAFSATALTDMDYEPRSDES